MPPACAASAALAAGMPGTTTAHAAGMPGTTTAHAAVAAAGASHPLTSAESATTTGTKIGPDHTQGTLASEASGRYTGQRCPRNDVTTNTAWPVTQFSEGEAYPSS
ncbi:hypothetical protein ACFVTC_40950 [Streptomyces sp. NPDC057950]|uniref:hypothetical protein n=1 Tax=Streptomyces sp. NPDC057950 TaxID=3346288 RepID=UPI0036E7A515